MGRLFYYQERNSVLISVIRTSPCKWSLHSFGSEYFSILPDPLSPRNIRQRAGTSIESGFTRVDVGPGWRVKKIPGVLVVTTSWRWRSLLRSGGEQKHGTRFDTVFT